MEKDKKVISLNLKSGEIKRNFPDEIFTESNHYFEDVDKFIRDKSETIIGNLYHNIKENNKEFKIIDISNMKNIFVLQHFRNYSFINSLNKNNLGNNCILHNLALKSLINSYLDNKEIDDNLDDGLKEIYNYIENMYSKITPGFLKLENTKRTLVLPASQFCFFKLKDNDSYLYPIAPDIALTWTLQPRKKIIEYQEVNQNDDAVKTINNLIINGELKDNTNNLIFGLEDEIEKIYNEKYK